MAKKPTRSPEQLGFDIDEAFAELSPSIPIEPPNPSNAQAWAAWEDECDQILGESHPFPGWKKTNAYSIQLGGAARALMDSLYKILDLPNNFIGDFWAIHGDSIARTLAHMPLYDLDTLPFPHCWQPDSRPRDRLKSWRSLPRDQKALILLADFYPHGPRYA